MSFTYWALLRELHLHAVRTSLRQRLIAHIKELFSPGRSKDVKLSEFRRKGLGILEGMPVKRYLMMYLYEHFGKIVELQPVWSDVENDSGSHEICPQNSVKDDSQLLPH